MNRFNERTIVFVALLMCLGGIPGCALRRVPPINSLPVLGYKPDYSMEGLLHQALGDQNPAVRKNAVRLLGTMITTPEEAQRPWDAR